MRLPEFTAETSLYRSSDGYSGVSTQASSSSALLVTPQAWHCWMDCSCDAPGKCGCTEVCGFGGPGPLPI
jgi:hypothetical protein